MFDRLHDHWAHGSTTCAGVVLMAVPDPATILSTVGALVGLGGLVCSLSREVRAWLDRRVAKPCR